MKSLKMQFEQRQRELEEMQSRLVPQMDNDMLRIKLINEIEGPHRVQLEMKQQEIDKLTEDN